MRERQPRACGLALGLGRLSEAFGRPPARPKPSRRPHLPRSTTSSRRDGRQATPGAVVVVGRGDQTSYEKAYGFRATVPAQEPMTLDTVFDLASLTKVVATTTAVMTLDRARPPAP